MPLTGKQKRALKGHGQRMPDDVILGKAGITAEFVEHARRLLDRKELLKIRFTDVGGSARKALADEVCRALEAECVQILGRTMLLYRANPGLDAAGRLLPDI
jgi:RNA-binding protein